MKRFRIWINSFNLVQQYLVVSFAAILVFFLFIFQFLNTSIDNFTSAQMISYLRRSQASFINAKDLNLDYVDNNAFHYAYDLDNNVFINYYSEDANKIIAYEDLNSIESEKSGILFFGEKKVVYLIKNCDSFYLISIISEEYQNEFKAALVSGIVNSIVIVFSIVFIILMAWVYSLIRPLNLIQSYITRIRNGENVKLNIRRNDEIGEVAEAVVQMNDELSNQQKIREEMIQNISHDLKTPIATIKSYCESIKDGIYPYDTLEGSVDVIWEHADRLEKKVYSLITYNKIGYLQDTCVGDNLLMKPVIEKAILSCKVLRNDISIDTSEVYDDVYFHGEEEPWRTAIENLLENSLRYAKSVIKISLSDNLFEISNDGELMPKERLDKLFKPYEKGNKGNFGLGLSIVKRVCETYGYNVVGENKADGVVFRIYRNISKSKQKGNKQV